MPPARSLRADDHPECRSGGPPCLGRRTAMRARQRSWTTPGTLSISRGGAGFRRGGRWGRSRRRLWTAWVTALVLAISFLPATVWPTTAPRAKAATTCGAGCHVTVNGLDFSSGAALTSFNFIVNVDNSKLPIRPALAEHGEQQPDRCVPAIRITATVTLPDGRYLISVRSLDHKMWGKHITLPGDADASGTLTAQHRADQAERGQPAAARQDPRLCLQGQRVDQRRPGHRGGRPAAASRSGSRSRPHSAVTVDYNNTRSAAASA